IRRRRADGGFAVEARRGGGDFARRDKADQAKLRHRRRSQHAGARPGAAWRTDQPVVHRAAQQRFCHSRQRQWRAAPAAAAMSGAEPELSPGHNQELARAHKLLESNNFATRLTDYAGKPIHGVLAQMPKPMRRAVDRAVERAIQECLKVALKSLNSEPKKRPSSRLASTLAGVAGGVGGLFGAASLPIELPVTTILMLRAIADIARHHGEDLST